jgi:hypothetical protein
MLKQSHFAGVRLTVREHEGIAANKKQKRRLQHQQGIATTVYQKIREWYLQHHDPVKALQSPDAHCLLRCAELKNPPKQKRLRQISYQQK